MCELWLIVYAGESVSLGMLPKQGRMQVAFNERITSLKNWQKLVQQGKLVISVETPKALKVAITWDLCFLKDPGLALWRGLLSTLVAHPYRTSISSRGKSPQAT